MRFCDVKQSRPNKSRRNSLLYFMDFASLSHDQMDAVKSKLVQCYAEQLSVFITE